MDMIKFEEKGFFELFAELNKAYHYDLYVLDRCTYVLCYYLNYANGDDGMIVLSTARGEVREFKSLDTIYELLKKHKVEPTFKIIKEV
jgi:hypothetical protein